MASSSNQQNNGDIVLIRKIEEDISYVTRVWGYVSRKEADIRLELRGHGGHKGKFNERVRLWLDHFDKVEKQFVAVCDSYYSVIMEVKMFQESPSSLSAFYDGDAVDRAPPGLASYVLVKMLVGTISAHILKHLNDTTVIRTASLYGGEGKNSATINEKIENRLMSYAVRIVRVWKDPDQKKFSDACDRYYSVIISIKLRSNSVMCGSLLKVAEQMLDVINEVHLLRQTASSLSVCYNTNGVGTVFRKFPSQPLISESARSVSNMIFEYLRDPTVTTIGLYGLGGVGKTTIMKNICEELADSEIFNKIIWVTMSKKMDYKMMQDEIAMQLGIQLLANDHLKTRAMEICNHLKIVQKCLFVLDDMWETYLFSTIGIPCDERCYCIKIVVTTRTRYICKGLKVDMTIRLEPLSYQEAYDLFVGRSGNEVLDPKIEPIAKEIIYECGGIPITIVTVGHAMRYEVKDTAWRRALEDIRSTKKKVHRDGLENVFGILKFGYNHLKNDQVRKCFLRCAIFPEDHKFESTELIHYWMAEDFLQNKGGIVSSINDGLEIVRELKDANMLEMVIEGGKEWFLIHDLFRDLAISIMSENYDFFVKAGQVSNLLEWEYWVKRISLIRNQINHLHTLNNSFSHLSVLLLRDNPLSYVSSSFFHKMPNLQVLDLSYSGITRLPPSLCELNKLRVLFLNFCTDLKKVPPLEKLKELRILNLRGTLIKKLPEGVKSMSKLRTLDLSETVRLEYIQDGVISALSDLEELQLQGSHLCKMESPMAATCFEEIRCLKQLSILTLSAVGFGDHLDTILHLQKHNLKSYSVSVYGSTLDDIEDL